MCGMIDTADTMPGKQKNQHQGLMTTRGEFYPEMETMVRDISDRLYTSEESLVMIFAISAPRTLGLFRRWKRRRRSRARSKVSTRSSILGGSSFTRRLTLYKSLIAS